MKAPGEKEYIQIAEGLEARKDPPPPELKDVDAVILDIDGVLVDVRGSFRQVTSLAVQYYFNRILEIPGDERLISAEDTGLFKMAGRFNNDWDLAKAAVAYGLMKLLGAGGHSPRSMEELRRGFPTLEEFTTEIKRCGGGLANTLEIVRKQLGESAYLKFEKHYKPELIKRIFMEHYAGGRLCRSFYGFDPVYYQGPGFFEKERFLLDLSLGENLSENGVSLGILSGRTPEEAEYLLRKTGMERIINPEFVITDDGTLPAKPDPEGLILLGRRMGFASAVYVGDMPDDWATVEAYASLTGNEPPIACCMVKTGAASAKMMSSFYEEFRVDYLAADVNSLLKHLAQLANTEAKVHK